MNNAAQMTDLLTMILIILGVIFFILLTILIIISVVQSKQKKEVRKSAISEQTTSETVSDARKIAKEYTRESIFKFMEFDRVEDNMVVQKNGNRYLMAVECQGVNYDLMSENEKISVEEGFLQFLNTLRHPIQIYIQTRTVNLNDSIENYKKKVEEIEIELEKKRLEYKKNVESGRFTKEQLDRQFYELTKQTNLYEYGKDIIVNTERMSLNKNVLNKKYYIIIPYYASEAADGAFDKEEIKNLAFSELYTKAQSLIRTLSACEVSGKVMDSNELVDLLYTAYNRDEAEVFSVEKALRSGYDELYSTAPDVLDKKMKQINENIEMKALEMVNDSIMEAKSRKEQEIEEKQDRFAELIRQRAEMILNQNESYLGKEAVAGAKKVLKEKDEKKNKKEEIDVEEKPKRRTRKTAVSTKEEGGDSDVKKETKTRRKSTTSK